MSTVTNIGSRKRKDDNTTTQGRVYCVLRDAGYWLDLDDIADTIAARFDENDSANEIQRSIAELIVAGEQIDCRMSLARLGREYLMTEGFPEGAA